MNGAQIMKRLIFLKFLIGFLIIAGSILYIAPFFWSFEEYRSQITTAIKSATGQNVTLRGGIRVQFLPLPEVQVSDVYLSKSQSEADSDAITSIKLIRIHLKPIALLTGKTQINRVTLVHPWATWENIRNIRGHWNAERKNSVAGSDTETALIPTNIENGKIYFGDSRQRSTTKIENINASVNASSLEGPFLVTGDFAVNGNKFSFDADISLTEKSGGGESTWKFVGDGFKVTFIGDLVGKEGKKNNTLSGAVEASSDDFDYIIAKYFQRKNVKRIGEKKEKEENPNQEVVNPFLARGNLVYSNQLFKISDLNITSGVVSGTGGITVSTERDIPDVDVNLTFDEINIDKFTHNAYSNQAGNGASGEEDALTAENFIAQTSTLEDPYERISRVIGGIAKEFNMLSEVNIKQLTYNKQSINKIIFNADVFNGDLVINEFTATMPGNSFFEVTGSMKHNAIRPRFSGEMSISGDNLRVVAEWLGFPTKDVPEGALSKYKLNSDVVLLPQKINLSSMDLSVDKTRGNGSVIIRYGDVSPKIISNLHISHLDLDTYHLTEPLIAVLKTYYNEDKDIPMSKNFNWLRSLAGQISGELTMDNTMFNQVNYREFSSLFSVSPGKLSIEKLGIDSDLVDLTASMSFDTTSIRPKIALRINADKLDTAAFSALEQPTPIANAPAQKTPGTASPERWSTVPFYFFGIDRFDGRVEINAKSFKHHLLELNDLALNLRLYEGTIGFDNFTSKYTTGDINVKGILNIEDTPNLAVSFALNNIELGNFLKAFTGMDSISGYSSVSGSVVTYGNNYAEWVKNAKSNMGAIGRAIKVSNFGLHDLISKSGDVTIAKQLNDIAHTAASNGTTTFDTVETQMQTALGMLDFTGMKLTTSRTSGIMSGRIDLANWLMNLVGKFAYISPDNDKTVNLGFNAVGPVDAPKKSFDLTELFKNKGIEVTPPVKN